MFQANEIVTLILGIGVLLFVMTGYLRFREFPEWKTFAAAFCVYCVGWLLTILEGLWVGFVAELLLASTFNVVEHVFYTTGSILFAIWCWKVFGVRKEVRS